MTINNFYLLCFFLIFINLCTQSIFFFFYSLLIFNNSRVLSVFFLCCFLCWPSNLCLLFFLVRINLYLALQYTIYIQGYYQIVCIFMKSFHICNTNWNLLTFCWAIFYGLLLSFFWTQFQRLQGICNSVFNLG